MPTQSKPRPITKGSRDAKKRQLALLRGDAPTLVPAGPAEDHVKMLRTRYGISHKTIAALSGISYATICALEYENHPEHRNDVWEATANAILAVTFTPRRMSPRAVVNPVGAVRRLRALMAIGYTARDLAHRLGVSPRNLLAITGQGSITAGLWVRIADLYDDLSMTPGPSAVGRKRATVKGWPPPLAWDEDEIDDPDARPYGMGAETVRSSHVVLELHRDGESLAAIADRLGIKEDSVRRSLERAMARERGEGAA